MNLKVIPSDKAIYMDGKAYANFDMSWVPDIDGIGVHAFGWDGEKGIIELVTPDPEVIVDELGIWEKAIFLWKERDTTVKEEQEKQKKIREILSNSGDPSDILDALEVYDETEISGPLVDTEEDNDDIEELIAELEDDEIEKLSEVESDLLESDFMALLGDDEKVDVMHQDLNQAIEDNPRDTSYTMEEQVENQIYYDIEELLKEI